MPHVMELHDFSDPALDVYARATENQLVNRADPSNALFIAESPLVIGRALDAGCVPVSFLMEIQHVAGKGASLLERCDPHIPVYTASLDVLTRLTGFHLTRGILCAMRRPPLPTAEAVCANARRIAVLENVMIGRHCRTKAGIWGALTRNPATRREEQESIDISYSLLETVHLQDLWNEKACNLAYGAQRRLEIARALATEPRMLLLDEPAAGMNPQETNELKDLVLQIRADRDLSILLIEHDMGMVMSLSDRIYVMEYGSRIAAGTPAEVRSNPRVIQAYLGESEDA